MFARRCVQGLLLLCLGISLVGCGNPSGLDSIQVTPPSQSLSVGQTAQFTAIGTFGNAKHPTTQNLSAGVAWSSSSPSVATVDASGMVTAVSAGTATITASAQAFNGPTTSAATLTVTGAGVGGGGGGTTGGSLISLTIIPSSIAVGNLQDTGQFLAIGTFSVAPFVRDLTNSPTLTWISATPSVFPVSTNTGGSLGATAGVVTAYGNGTGVITAEAKNPADGTIQTATAQFSCPLKLPTATEAGSCFPGSQAPALLATLTVYNEGLNTTDWDVTAPSASGTPNVLHCGPGDPSGTSVCTATYPFTNPPVIVVLKASGGAFGGWSYNCTPSDAQGNPVPGAPIDPNGPNYCAISFDPGIGNTNVTVGAIFN
jgi:Bacterial Ig-like domain (group 2)